MIEGKPGDRQLALYFVDSNPASAKWLGIITRTKKGRLLFFPGTRVPFRLLESNLPAHRPIEIDHLTMETDGTRSHITSAHSAQHVPIGAPKKVDDATHWFTLHYQSSVFMHPVSRSTKLIYDPIPGCDAGRRAEEFGRSRDGMNDLMIRLNPSVRHWNHNHLGFTVWVGAPGFADCTRVPKPADGGFKLEEGIRIHRIGLDGHTELQIVSYCLSEYLRSEAAFYF